MASAFDLATSPPPHTPQLPPSCAQCRHELQLVHAVHVAEPVHLLACSCCGRKVASIDISSIEIALFKIDSYGLSKWVLRTRD